MAAVLGIDPGTWETAYVGYDATNDAVIEHGFVKNAKMLELLRDPGWHRQYGTIGIEMIASYGMPVGKETFATVVWIGRMVEIVDRAPEAFAVEDPDRGVHTLKKKPSWRLCYRKQIIKWFCKGAGAGDSQLRAALSDRFPATGGGAKPVWGTKKQPGPLYGVTGTHKLAALSVAMYAAETVGTMNAIPETTKG